MNKSTQIKQITTKKTKTTNIDTNIKNNKKIKQTKQKHNDMPSNSDAFTYKAT